MLSIPLNEGAFYETDADSLYLLFKPTIWAQTYTRKHTNCITPLQERNLPTPLHHAERAVILKLSNVTFAEFFTSTSKI